MQQQQHLSHQFTRVVPRYNTVAYNLCGQSSLIASPTFISHIGVNQSALSTSLYSYRSLSMRNSDTRQSSQSPLSSNSAAWVTSPVANGFLYLPPDYPRKQDTAGLLIGGCFSWQFIRLVRGPITVLCLMKFLLRVHLGINTSQC